MNARTGFAIVLVGILAVLSVLVVRPFLSYVLGAMLLAFTLSPLQRRLAPEVGPRVAAMALVTLAAVLVVAPVVILLTVGVAEIDVAAWADELTGLGPIQNEMLDQFADRIVSGIAERTSGFATAGVHASLGIVLLVFLLYYLLKDGHQLVKWAKRVTPLPRDVQDELYDAAEDATWAVLKGHIFVAIVQGVVAGAALFVTGVPNAAFWTGVMMVLAIVPIIGVFPVLVGAAIYLAMEGDPIVGVLVIIYGLTIVALVDDYLRALVIDKESALHSGTILLGVFGAAYFLGAIGLFVGPIILGLFKATVEVFTDYYDIPAYA